MFGFIGNIGAWELAFILVIALIVVGPGKLPEVARSLGKATRDFKKATAGIKREIDDVMKYDDVSVGSAKKGAVKGTAPASTAEAVEASDSKESVKNE